MNKQGPETREGQLPLPSPRSPRKLDEKILAHARANAPQKRASLSKGWTGGMATAAVLVVTVYLTAVTETNSPPERPAPAMLEEQGITAGASAPAAKQARAKRKLEIGAAYDSLKAAPREDAADLHDADSLEGAYSVKGANSFEKEELQMESAAAMASIRAPEPKASAAKSATRNLQGTLAHLLELVDQGKTEQARREYEELLNACGECSLPDTLEQAMEALAREPAQQR